MGSLPGLLLANGWTASRRALLVEVKESGGVVRIQLVLGPAGNRQQIFDALRKSGADIGGTHSIGKSWRQLANMALAVDPQDTTDEAFDKLIDGVAAFLSKHVPVYTPVLRQVGSPRTTAPLG